MFNEDHMYDTTFLLMSTPPCSGRMEDEATGLNEEITDLMKGRKRKLHAFNTCSDHIIIHIHIYYSMNYNMCTVSLINNPL